MEACELIARVTEWARQDERVFALCLCGSHARGEAHSDSDIDFCILSIDPQSLLEDFSWVSEIGPEVRVAGPIEDYNLVQSVRVFYGTAEAEFGVTGEEWAQIPIDQGTASVINDGLKILYDPDGRLARAAAFAAKFVG